MSKKVLIFSFYPNLAQSKPYIYRINFDDLKEKRNIHSALALLDSYLEKEYDAKLVIMQEESYDFKKEDFINKTRFCPEFIEKHIHFERFPIKGFIEGKSYDVDINFIKSYAIVLFHKYFEEFSPDIVYLDISRGHNYLNALAHDAYKAFVSGLKSRIYPQEISKKLFLTFSVITDEKTQTVYRTKIDVFIALYKYTSDSLLKKQHELNFISSKITHFSSIIITSFTEALPLYILTTIEWERVKEVIENMRLKLNDLSFWDNIKKESLKTHISGVYIHYNFLERFYELVKPYLEKIFDKKVHMNILKDFNEKVIKNELRLNLAYSFINRELNYWSDFYKGENKNLPKGDVDIKRNFFAHAGLSHSTLDLDVLIKEGCFKYKEEKIKKIKSWVKALK